MTFDDEFNSIVGDDELLAEDELLALLDARQVALSEAGYTGDLDFLYDLDDLDPDTLRGLSFTSFDDAFAYLEDGGILDLFGIVEVEPGVFDIFERYKRA